MKIGGARVLLAETESVGSQSSSSSPSSVGTAGVGVEAGVEELGVLEADVEETWVMNMLPEVELLIKDVELLVKDVSDDEAVDDVAPGVGSSVGPQSSVSVGTEMVAEVVEEPPMDADDVMN